jgi:hypothetical protein
MPSAAPIRAEAGLPFSTPRSTPSFNSAPAPRPKGVLMRLGIDPNSLQQSDVPKQLRDRLQDAS